MIIRPIAQSDLPALRQIAVESGPGFTSLMDDPDFLTRKIQHSIDSFSRAVSQPGPESYLFVMEDVATGEVMGTSGIEAAVGLTSPLYHYHQSRVVHHSRQLGLYKAVDVLNLCNHYTGCSEICTLYLRPRYRRPNAGKLLSKVRFLFMAQQPQRFASRVIAEMRGISSDDGRSPFWEWLREHFVDLDFPTVTQLVGAGDKGFVAELMPKYPLYTHLLSATAQEVIGQVHPETRPALRMLEGEGFRHRGYVDPFDAGPTVEAELSAIRSLAESIECEVQTLEQARGNDRLGIVGKLAAPIAIANSGTLDFRAVMTDQARYRPERKLLQIPATLMSALGLTDGARARFVRLAGTSTARQPAEPEVPLASDPIYRLA